jgi:hypothetical protein
VRPFIVNVLFTFERRTIPLPLGAVSAPATQGQGDRAARTVQRIWRGHANRTGALLAKHACHVPARLEAQRQHVLNIARSYVGKLHWGNAEECGGGYLTSMAVSVENPPAELAEFGYSAKRLIPYQRFSAQIGHKSDRQLNVRRGP